MKNHQNIPEEALWLYRVFPVFFYWSFEELLEWNQFRRGFPGLRTDVGKGPAASRRFSLRSAALARF
jgi:hypothetical protein